MEVEQTQPKRKRRRPPKACDSCRQRKIRCNQLLPCDQCIRLKLDHCSYDPQSLLKRATKTWEGGPGPIATRSVPLTPVSTPDQEDSTPRSALPALATSSSLSHSPSAALSKRSDDVYSSYHNSTELSENQSIHVPQHDTRNGQCLDEISIVSDAKLKGTITKTRLLGRSHWVNVVTEVCRTPFLFLSRPH